MRFADQRNHRHAGAVHRVRAVRSLLSLVIDPHNDGGWSADRDTISGARGTIIYTPEANNGAGMIQFQDGDGEARSIDLPPGLTSEGVAGLLYGLAMADAATR